MTAPLLTLDEAAALLHVSRVTVWRRIKSGALRGFQDGGIVRTREDWVQEYVDAKSAPAPTVPKPSRNPKYARR